MKNLAQLLVILFLFNSCGNPCDDIDCGPNGTCLEDTETCHCFDFYYGARCEMEVRTKFLKTYEGWGNCWEPNMSFDVILQVDAADHVSRVKISSEAILDNFEFEAKLDGYERFDIPQFEIGADEKKYVGHFERISGNYFMELKTYSKEWDLLSTCNYTFLE